MRLILTDEEKRALPLEMQKFGQLYRLNTIRWQPGDLVIHDDDKKDARMLMYVTRVLKNDMIETKYARPQGLPAEWQNCVWKNPIHKLHDPALFRIPIP